jgi:hypothetical protein
MAWSLPCRLCSGCYDFRRDNGLRNLYRQIKGNKQKIDELVNFSPCAAIKLCLTYKDEDIATAFVARYENDTSRLPNCQRRKDLIWQSKESRGVEKLPYLASLAGMVEYSLFEKTSGSASVICGLNSIEAVFGRATPVYDDVQQQAWAPIELLMEEFEDNGFSLKNRLHRHPGS